MFGKLVEETEGSFGVIFTYIACALGESLLFSQSSNACCWPCQLARLLLPQPPLQPPHFVFTVVLKQRPDASPPLLLPQPTTGAAALSVFTQPAIVKGAVSVSLGASGAIFGLFAGAFGSV